MSKPIDQELLPCPFCGGEEPAHDESDTAAWVECTTLGCGACGPLVSNEAVSGRQNAAALWNARAAVQPAGGAVPGIREFAEEVKQLCKDFSDLRDRPYMGDVTASIDGLYNDFMSSDAMLAAPHPVSGEQIVDQHNAAYWQEQYELLRKDYQRTLDEARVAVPEGYMVLPIKPSPAMKAACRIAGKTQVWADMVAAHRAQQGEQP